MIGPQYKALSISSNLDEFTVIKSTDCTYVDLYSYLINNFSGQFTLRVKVTDLVTNNTSTITLAITDISTDSNNRKFYRLNTENQGIFEIQLESLTDDVVTTIQKVCVYNNCKYECNLVNSNIETVMLDFALRVSEGCNCECSNLRKLYKLMLKELEININLTNTNSSDDD